jgi:hypothetical protein
MATTMKLRNGKMLVKKDNYYERLKYFSDIYNDVSNIYSMNYNRKKRIDVIYNIYSLLYDAFENIHREYVRSANKREDSFLNLIIVLERRGNIILRDIKEPYIDIFEDNILVIEKNPTNIKHLENIVVKTIQKIQKHVKLHKKEKNNVLCRLSCKLGSHLTLYVNSFL